MCTFKIRMMIIRRTLLDALLTTGKTRQPGSRAASWAGSHCGPGQGTRSGHGDVGVRQEPGGGRGELGLQEREARSVRPVAEGSDARCKE